MHRYDHPNQPALTRIDRLDLAPTIWLATVILLVMSSLPTVCSGQTIRTLSPPAKSQTPRFDPAAINSAQIVLLKNSSVMKGRVLDQGPERLTLQTPEGSRLVLTRDRVLAVCNSLQEAYWKLAAETRASDTEGQATLMRWCLKHDLIQLAENQFNILIQTDISAQKLEGLFRQLDHARNRMLQKRAKIDSVASLTNHQRSSESPAISQTTTPLPKDANRQTTIADHRPKTLQPSLASELNKPPMPSVVGVWQPKPTNVKPMKSATAWNAPKRLTTEGTFVPATQVNSQSGQGSVSSFGENEIATAPAMIDSMVAPVGFDEVTPEPTTENHKPVERLSNRQLERFARELPKGSIAFFRRRVEPMVIKNCSRCHHQQHAPRLIRGHDRTNSLTYSRRNIHSLIDYIQSSPSPEESAIWKAITEPHGGLESALLAKNSQQAEHVLLWMRMIRPEDASQTSESQTSDRNAPANWDQPIQPVMPLRDGNPIASPSELDTIGEIPSLEKVSKSERGFVPKDPFDPEIFNRRQAEKRVQRED